MANDLLSALRTYLSKVSSGEKSPQEVAAALNVWARESGEAIKARVEEELRINEVAFAPLEEHGAKFDEINKELSDALSSVEGISN